MGNGYHSPSRDSNRYETSSPDASARRSPSRRSHRHRSSRRDRHHRHSPSRDPARAYDQQYLPNIQPPQSFADHSRIPAPMQYIPSVRLPLLRLGGSSFMAAPTVFMQPRLVVPPAPPVPAIVPVYIPVPPAPRQPLPTLHLAPQLPPPASLQPHATRADQQRSNLVHNVMHQFAEQHRPRLQLLQLRPHPQIRQPPPPELTIPMPAPNVVTTSTETKIDAGIQAEVPRQDGFVIEPGLFQVSQRLYSYARCLLFHRHFFEMLLV